MAPRGIKLHDRLVQGTKELPQLVIGDHVMVQNQLGNRPKRWDRRGVVVQADTKTRQYKIMIFGSRKLTLRNRRFLRKHAPAFTPTGTPTGLQLGQRLGAQVPSPVPAADTIVTKPILTQPRLPQSTASHQPLPATSAPPHKSRITASPTHMLTDTPWLPMLSEAPILVKVTNRPACPIATHPQQCRSTQP